MWSYIYASIGFIVANVGYNHFIAKYHFSTSEFFGFVSKYLQRFEIVQWHIWDVEDKGDDGEVLEGAE